MNTKKIALLIGALVLLGAAVFGISHFTKPVGYLSIDVNPSIEMTYNRMNKVVEVKGLNPEGEAILAKLKANRGDVDDVVESIVAELVSAGYLTDINAKLLLSADDSHLSRQLLTRLNYEVIYWLREHAEEKDILSQVVSLDDDDASIAKRNGISLGKYLLVKQIFGDLDDDQLDTVKNMSVGQMIEFARENDIPLHYLIRGWDDDYDDMDDDDDDDMDDDDDDDMDDDDDDDMDDDDDDDMDDDDDDDWDDDDDDDWDDDDDDDDDDGDDD